MIVLPKNINDRYNLIASVLKSHNGNISKTASALQISNNCVKSAKKCYDEGSPHREQQGRPTKLNSQIKYFICITTINFPEMSGAELALRIQNLFHIDVSDDTVNRCRTKYSFKYGQRIRALPITAQHANTRLMFSNWFFMSGYNHQTIVFSDESWFEIGTANHYVWRISGEVYPTILKTDLPHPPKVMIWGAIGHNFKSNLVFFQSSVTSDTYFNNAIVGSALKQNADYVYGINSWYYQQDNARPHVSRKTLNNLHNIGINLLPFWPPHSPDLSPIEIVWAIMGKRVEKFRPKTVYDLKVVIQYVWDNLSFHTINSLIDSFPRRLRKCIQNRGSQVRI